MIFLNVSLTSLVFLWKNNDFLKIIVQIFDLPAKNNCFCKDCRANLWFSFEKQMNFSPGCVIQICNSDKLQIPPNDPLDTFGSESAFASKGYIENVTFWAPSIFQKLGVPDLRLLGSKWVAKNQSNMKVGFWTYQSYFSSLSESKSDMVLLLDFQSSPQWRA